MTIWFTADLHFGHANIVKYCSRPWPDVDAMNLGLIDNWNDTVDPADHVVVLGDVALGKITETLPLVGRLNGTKTLIPGNHDRCWSGATGFEKWEQRYLDAGFSEIIHDVGIKMLGERQWVKLCHFPYKADPRHGARFDEWLPLPGKNSNWLLHGHVHEDWKVKPLEHMVNVGVDVHNYRPVSEAALVDMIFPSIPHLTEVPAKVEPVQ